MHRERIEVVLSGGKPWGFSIKGGTENNKSIVVSKVLHFSSFYVKVWLLYFEHSNVYSVASIICLPVLVNSIWLLLIDLHCVFELHAS